MSSYDKFPTVAVSNCAGAAVTGWDAIAARLARDTGDARVVVVECYPGVDEDQVLVELSTRLTPSCTIAAKQALKTPAEIVALVAPFNGGDDPIFGRLNDLTLAQFFDAARLQELRRQVAAGDGLVLIVGTGASLIADADLLVYADLARWEAQQRMRRNEIANLGLHDATLQPSLQYKRAYFTDWRVCDRLKPALLPRSDFLLDTNTPAAPKLVTGDAFRHGLRHVVSRPFRVVPFFDPGPWGGQWLKTHCDLDPDAINYAWCFDCVPEENSLLLDFDGCVVEVPAIDLVLAHPIELLGDRVHARFGAEFPIRFDFLDTIGGGNLSFQVHPLTAYMREHFGLTYTQDESYYLLAAGADACVYLGLKSGVDAAAMARDLQAAQRGELAFPADAYANRWPAKRHDHFLIPAGTVHCSGRNSMVLEISATPYIFTFKLWDWGRLGLDGKPRPINIERGLDNIVWERDTAWTAEHLVNRVEPLGTGPGWREERTGLHETQFIETRRHWFTDIVPHHTGGGVNVLNLVQGDEVLVESPDGAFAPCPVHYAETFIVPAAVGAYTIRPTSTTSHATLKAYVR